MMYGNLLSVEYSSGSLKGRKRMCIHPRKNRNSRRVIVQRKEERFDLRLAVCWQQKRRQQRLLWHQRCRRDMCRLHRGDQQSGECDNRSGEFIWIHWLCIWVFMFVPLMCVCVLRLSLQHVLSNSAVKESIPWNSGTMRHKHGDRTRHRSHNTCECAARWSSLWWCWMESGELSCASKASVTFRAFARTTAQESKSMRAGIITHSDNWCVFVCMDVCLQVVSSNTGCWTVYSSRIRGSHSSRVGVVVSSTLCY